MEIETEQPQTLDQLHGDDWGVPLEELGEDLAQWKQCAEVPLKKRGHWKHADALELPDFSWNAPVLGMGASNA